MSEVTIIDKQNLITTLKLMLEPTRTERHATPDVSWIVPMVRDVLLEEMIVHARGNQVKAARQLGINRGTLRNYLAQFDEVRYR
ncbi:helix-turn-helix domain-containing protein [Vibrio splendidus]